MQNSAVQMQCMVVECSVGCDCPTLVIATVDGAGADHVGN